MAEQVELQVEDMIPELEMMDKLGIFNKNEKRNLIKKRKLHEYRLQRVTKSKDDILRYIKFEVELLMVVKQKTQEKGIQLKKNNLVYSITNRINRLYNIAIRRFPSDCKLWISYLKYCKQVKLYTCVSRLLDQMLELHGDKPTLFKIAANWEFNECHSIERARRFIHQGLHVHKDSKLLFTEGFKLELAYANQKFLQAKEKAEKNENDLPADPIIEGNLADVIYTSAIKKINDVTFFVDLLNIAQAYSFTSSLQEKIIEGMKNKYPNEEVTWDTLARRELEVGGTLQERIRKCISVYEDGLRNVPTKKMWSFYLDYILKINEDATTLPDFKKDCLRNAFETAHRENMLSEKHYFLWIKKVEDADACKILKWGTERLGSSSKLWSWRLRYHLSKSDEDGAMAVFKEIISNPNIPEQANIWLLVLKYYQIIDTAKAESLWNEGVNNPIVGATLKGRYIEWLAMTRGIMAARKAYSTLSTTPPLSLGLHEAMAKLEDAQPKVSGKFSRQVYETAVNQYGKTDTDVWMWYVKFELKFGKPDLVPKIYEQAVKTLNSNLVDVFISEFHLHKAETMNNDRGIMPGRRKTSLSRSTSPSRRKQDERAVETEEKREARLATDRARHAAARAQESAKQREARLASARTRQAASRAGESEEERAARLADDREYHAASRADETEEDRTARLSRVREYYAASRGDETEEDRAARLSRDREYHAASRADETEEDRAARLSRGREYHAASRADETEEDRTARLSRDREYHAASRADETEEDRAARLSRGREYHAASRADETEEDRAARLSRDREYHAASRADETEEDRAARLSRDREYHAASRADETEDDRAARLSRGREYHAASRADETEEDRATRLSRDREYHAASRADETEEDRAARLSRDREYHAASRADETEEDRAARLSRDREYHAASRADETEEDRAARLSRDREYHAASRADETEEDRAARLSRDREYHAASRADETEEDRAARLSRDREYHAASRADETEEDRAARLSRGREYHAASRADETEEDRAARLSRDREYHAASRADETEEDRAARLSRDREYHAASRADETEDDRAARLSRGREYHAASRADETEEDRAARLSRDREYHAASRADETEEDRAARLSRDREYHAASRADETEEDRAARLSTDRAHHSAARLAESQAERDTRRRSDRIRQAQRRSTLTEEEHSRILEARREDHARRQEQAQRQREERGQATFSQH